MDLFKLMIRRYFDLTLLAAASLLLITFISRSEFLKKFIEEYSFFISSLPLFIACIFPFLLALIIQKLLITANVLNTKRVFSPSIKYPPLYFSVWLVILALLLTQNVSSNYFLELPILIFVISLITINLIHVTLNFRVPRPKKNIENEQLKSNQWEQWIAAESPVENDQFLLFDRHIYVDRIIARLTSVNQNSSQIALCGAYGSGKSSITNIICNELELQSWITVKVDNWGRDHHSIGSQILTIIIEKLSEKIDTSAFQPLPSNYQNALKAKGGWYNFINQLSNKFESSYNRQISELDSILSHLQIKLLIILEDIDRNEKSLEFCNQLAVLLDKLKETKSISFIVNVGYSKESAYITSRVCDYREDLSIENHMGAFDALISVWVKRAYRNNIYLLNSYDKPFNLQNSLDSHYTPSMQRVGSALNTLVKTPRSLKQICRRVDEIWSKGRLIGEIDLINLILFQTIRETSPHLYTLIKLYQRELIDGVQNPFNHKDDLNADKEKLRSLFRNEMPNNSTGYSIDGIMNKIFPRWPSFDKDEHHYSSDNHQEIASESAYISYIGRCLKEQLSTGELSDQVVMNSIIKYKNSRNLDKANQEFITQLIDSQLWVERTICFSKQYWIKNESHYDQKILASLFIGVFRTVERRFNNGDVYEFEFTFSNYVENYRGLFALFDWAHLNFRFSKQKRLMLIGFKFLIQNDLKMLNNFLTRMESFKVRDIQGEVIKQIENGIKNESIKYLYLTETPHQLLFEISNNLSYKGNEHSLSKYYSIKDWENIIRNLLDNANLDNPDTPKIIAIISAFFIRPDDNVDSNVFIEPNLSEISKLLLQEIKHKTITCSITDVLEKNPRLRESTLQGWLDYLNSAGA